MTKKSLLSAISLLLVLVVNAPANQYKVVGESRDFYFGHISYVETAAGAAGPTVLRDDRQLGESAALNMPLGPGDIIETTDASRCEIQFDNGTIVRLDTGTKLKIESILAESLSTTKKISNLLLARGQVYVMHRRYDSRETFQVITPRAAVKLSDEAVALIEMTDGRAAVQVERGRAEALYGQDKDNVGQKKVGPGERIVVDDQDVLQPAEHSVPSEFRTWNEGINAHFAKLHQGNVLPKPYQNLPKAVFDFAQNFGNPNGEWVWHDLYGYVWRPYINDFRYPWGVWQADWQPYFYGNWEEYKGKLYWIPAEYWGWVPYHLGLWMWDKKAGWVWLPGSLFASAWVQWDFFFGDYAWRPLSLFDFGGWWPGLFWEVQGGGWNGLGWPGGGGGTSQPDMPVRNAVSKDELKKPANPTMPLPKELKGPLQAVQTALRHHDEGVLASYRETIRQSVIVRKEDFGRPGWQEKTVPFDRYVARANASVGAPLRLSSESVARSALWQIAAARLAEFRSATSPSSMHPARTVSRQDFAFESAGRPVRRDVAIQKPAGSASPVGPAAAGTKGITGTADHGGRGALQPGLRFRDWNPDVQTAIRMGVHIAYSTRTNEIFCPELGSAGFSRLSRGVDLDGFSSNGRPGFFGSSGGATGGNYSTAGTGSYSSSSSSSSAPRGSSKEDGGGKKN